MSTLISKIAYSLEKHQKTQKSCIFFCSRPNMAVFQIFQDTFFCGPLISIQEGLVKALILVPPLFAAETDLFGPSYGCMVTYCGSAGYRKSDPARKNKSDNESFI